MSSSENSRATALTLVLAGVASIVELGPLFALLRAEAGMTAILLCALGYQLGNALAGRIACPPAVLAVVACLCAAALFLLPPGHALWLMSLAFLSWSLQTIRRHIATSTNAVRVSTAQKRLARVAGFVASSLLPIAVIALVVGALCTAGALHAHTNPARQFRREPAAHPARALEWIMVVHQLHYFTYCYAVLALLERSRPGSIWPLGILFALGWVTYLSAEALLRRFDIVISFVLGHVFVAATLVGLSIWSANFYLVTLMWLLTGFGGGTVYCITQAYRRSGSPPDRLERFEDAGHIGGVVVALLATAIFGTAPAHLPLVAATFAVVAAGGMFLRSFSTDGAIGCLHRFDERA